MEKVGYGQHLAKALHVGQTQTLVTRPILQKSEIAVTEVRRDVPENDYTSAVPQEDAFLITLNIRRWPKRVLWIDDKPVHALPLEAGSSNIFDLRRKYIGYGVSSFHMMSFYLPKAVLSAVAELDDTQEVDELPHDPSGGIDDTVIRDLGLSLFPAFQRPDEANLLFVDHVTTALAAHALHTFAPKRDERREAGMARWQEQRVKEILSAHLDGNVTVAQLANACGLPLSRFAPAFIDAVGMQPHKWLLQRRLDRAMALMRQTTMPIDHIARECGFASERHLARVFRRLVGSTPHAWQQAHFS